LNPILQTISQYGLNPKQNQIFPRKFFYEKGQQKIEIIQEAEKEEFRDALKEIGINIELQSQSLPSKQFCVRNENYEIADHVKIRSHSKDLYLKITKIKTVTSKSGQSFTFFKGTWFEEKMRWDRNKREGKRPVINPRTNRFRIFIY